MSYYEWRNYFAEEKKVDKQEEASLTRHLTSFLSQLETDLALNMSEVLQGQTRCRQLSKENRHFFTKSVAYGKLFSFLTLSKDCCRQE